MAIISKKNPLTKERIFKNYKEIRLKALTVNPFSMPSSI
jgi:hypothetical protein